MEEFQKETESANTVSFKVYNVKNLLLIYIYEDELSQELEQEIEGVIKKMNMD